MPIRGFVVFLAFTLSIISSPIFARASIFIEIPEPDIYFAGFLGLPQINYNGYGGLQTAIKTGETFLIHVVMLSKKGEPTVSADLSQLGIAEPVTVPAYATDNNLYAYYGAITYGYNFGPFTVGADISDGEKDITITATSRSVGTSSLEVSTKVLHLIVDTIPPTASLTKATFSPEPLLDSGFTAYVSGSVHGTGSVASVPAVEVAFLKADGTQIQNARFIYAGPSVYDLNTAISSSADGSFENVPILMSNWDSRFSVADAAAFRITMAVADQAGNITTTSVVATRAPPDPCAEPGACASNVLFLPGIEGSRLYYRGLFNIEHQVWEPDYHSDIPYLSMNSDGTSKYPLYTKDIIGALQEHNALWNTIAGIFKTNLDAYNGLESFMDDLVAKDTIKEWRAYPYDWRYDVRDIVNNGTLTEMSDGSVQTVYLKNVLEEMALNSPSGKVTIVAHSNGGLLAKALAVALGDDASKYIDRIIMIGTPQWGTPMAVGALLHSDNFSDIPSLIINSTEARDVVSGMSGVFPLLPSSAYFSRIIDPIVTFDTNGTLSSKFANNFGSSLTSFSAFVNFLEDSAGLDVQMGRANDLRVPLALSSTLVDKGIATQTALDAWTPPDDIKVTAIAGWGQDTVKTLAYTTKQRVLCGSGSAVASPSLCVETFYLEHSPITTQDGDGTVVSPSAVGNTNDVLYFDSKTFQEDRNGFINHQNLTSARPVQDVLTSIFLDKDETGEPYIKATKPIDNVNSIILRISSHSPVNLVITDAQGNESGVLPIPGTDFSGIKRDISGSSVQVFDDEQYISVPEGGTYQVMAEGYSAGLATLVIETIDGDAINTTATFTSIPTTASSTVTFSIANDTLTAPAVDLNGDGNTDFVATSSSIGSDPLVYVRYMRDVIKTMSLSKNNNQIDEKLGEIERQLASSKRESISNIRLLSTIVHYVEQRIAFTNSQKRILPAQAEIILDMINELKRLL